MSFPIFKSPQLDALILIVDDKESNVLLLQSILEDSGFTNLKTTTDSSQVVSLARELIPDLILLDLMMPDPDGYAIMEQLRLVVPPDTFLPILVLTADITQDAKQRALALGAKDFITKPFNQVEVLLRINNLLETHDLHVQQKKQNQILEEKVTERTEQIQRQLERLEALHKINTAIAGSLDLKGTLNIALEQIGKQLNVDGADVLLLNQESQTLQYAAKWGYRTKTIELAVLRLGEGQAGRVALNRKTLHLDELAPAVKDFRFAELLSKEGFKDYSGVPLVSNGKVKGVLEVFHRKPFIAKTEWLDFLETIAGSVAIAINSAQMFTGLQRSNFDLALAYDATIEGWSKALDLRDKETEGHTLRVTELTLRFARSMGLTETDLIHIQRGSMLHDIGKMGVPDMILLKAGPLTEIEWQIMHKHPVYANDLLSPIAYLRLALDIPYCHHEKWDGSGYPRRLKGEQIPLAARIFALVDVYDALTSDRPYRPAWTKEKAIENIQSGKGTHFDPDLAEVFLKMMKEAQTA